jgi:4-coumarate--CoA ligase
MHEADGLTSEAIDVEEGHPGELWLRGPTITKVF